MAPYWRQLQEHGIGVIAIAETPEIGLNGPACVARYGPSSPKCSVPRDEADVLGQPIGYAGQAVGGTVPLIYMNSLICERTTCTAMAGNVLVCFDDDHLAQACTLTLTPYLSREPDEGAGKDSPGHGAAPDLL